METELKEFIRTCDTLTTNDKYVINSLSVMAMKAKENEKLSKEIGKVAIANIFKAPSNTKLYYFYAVDSILKNVGTPYKEIFSEKIGEAFINTFQSNKDHKIRIKLYNLRLTWKDYFDSDLMNKLDEMVKKYDPAWPLVTKFVPKVKVTDLKKSDNSENDSSKSSPDSTTPSVSRDPRVQKLSLPPIKNERKRKSVDKDDEDNLFTIDRRGDNQIKNIVNKMGRLEEKSDLKTEQTKADDTVLFGVKDIDLRITDNRFVKDKQWTSEDVFAMLERKLQNGVAKSIPASVASPVVQSVLQLPAPREPTWRVQINGFPQMPDIGTDPRLLDRCPFPDPFRTITIDGRQHLLYLDRIQPCIFVNNELHAVRFYYPGMLELRIDNSPFILSTHGLTHIKINRRFYVACLGGPGHELILNGWPYNVRIDGKVHQITVGGITVNVQFIVRLPVQVNIQLSIPPYVCEWAVNHLFGLPQYLNIPPLNPLQNIKLQDQKARLFREQLNQTCQRSDTLVVAPTAAAVQPEMVPPVAPVNIDVHDLYKRLIDNKFIRFDKAASTSKVDFNPDIAKYSWDSFKTRNVKEISLLQSGHQCDLCGTRFRNKDSKEFELHLDYHFYKNTSVTSTRKSRNYVGGTRQWILGGSVRGTGPDFSGEDGAAGGACGGTGPDCDQRFRCPMFEDDSLNKCTVCMEGFETVWDDEEDSFMLLDGQLHNNRVYHPICLEDADKQNLTDMQVNECDRSQIELTDSPLEALEKVLQGKSGSVVLPDHSNSQMIKLESEVKIESEDFNYESANS